MWIPENAGQGVTFANYKVLNIYEPSVGERAKENHIIISNEDTLYLPKV